ncbi:MAG: 50S ribosomal protein L1 [Candidatus Beckwithbacteria bacterium GW2011_GWA2_43_10]|uniref:Ribosomal protein n=1 Tax=Candidatus Beckwithbacteria bacterium GW2011_GWA2_43_10 TaxID=1618369 RepID=A0A0G1E7W3_9BACT|nr:MAG: 50S ribosomal protein L1 [Candidatus Beckwithbacteria bacterium GW2011_GWA2_43_10]
MGKKKIALIDLSQSETPQLKASGVRSQKLTKSKVKKTVEVPLPVQGPTLPAQAGLQEKKPDLVKKHRVKHPRSQRYLVAKAKIDKTRFYPIEAAVKLLREVSLAKFDPSVEFHASLTGEKLSGELTLPHGSGKKVKVEIATEATLTKLNDRVIDFDILVAEPKIMPQLAKYAKFLGPKGLMPNPKTGTISDKPEEVKKKLEAGAFRYKSEPKAPLIHLTIGKLSFSDDQLIDNINTVIKTLQPKNLSLAHLCSSMSPSIKLQFSP